MSISRRSLIVSAAAAPILGRIPSSNPLKVIVAGGHPGDPECGCGGTVARFSALGHEVVLLYLTRGEGFCLGASQDQCGSIRTAEAAVACKILKCQPLFAGQVDALSILDNTHYASFERLLTAQKPDVVFCHWPIDSHRDHRALSMLVFDAWLIRKKSFALYYYEVAGDSMMFRPTEYVDISDAQVESTRRAACYSHKSQQPDKWYPDQVRLTRFRGVESGHQQAEGFVRHWQSKSVPLP